MMKSDAEINSMIISIARNYSWASPFVLNEMFVDKKDYMGLEFWYNDAKEMQPKKVK